MFGFKAINNAGSVQIDPDFENMLLVKEGTVNTLSTLSIYDNTGITAFPSGLLAEDVYIAINFNDPSRHVILQVFNDNGFKLMGFTAWNQPAVFQVNYRLYAKASKVINSLVNNSSYGLLVNRPGSKVFDSRNKALRIQGFVTETYNGGNVASITSTFANISSLGFTPWVGMFGTLMPHYMTAANGWNWGAAVSRGVGIGSNSINLQNVRIYENGYEDESFVLSFQRTLIISD